jgi:hypothetical protein
MTPRFKRRKKRAVQDMGTARRDYTMNLNQDDKVWIPEDQEQYLLVYRGSFPKTRELFLIAQANLLKRLVEEASPEEIEDANRRLRLNLEQEVLIQLPGKLLNDPSCPSRLMLNPMSEGSPMHEWKSEIRDAMDLPSIPQSEVTQEAESLNLEVFLSRLL